MLSFDQAKKLICSHGDVEQLKKLAFDVNYIEETSEIDKTKGTDGFHDSNSYENYWLNETQQTILHVAIRQGNVAAVKVLLAKEADSTIPYQEHRGVRYQRDLTSGSIYGNQEWSRWHPDITYRKTCIELANGNPAILKLLNPPALDESVIAGVTALSVASSAASSSASSSTAHAAIRKAGTRKAAAETTTSLTARSSQMANIALDFTQKFRSPSKALPEVGNKQREKPRKKKSHAAQSEEEIAENERTNKAIGDLGEEYVYEKIKHLLQSQGFIEDPATEDKFTKDGINVELKWFNKHREPEELVDESPVDLVLAINGVDRYFIEVKSTLSNTNPYFYFTTNEWKYMRTYGEHSVLVRAYGVGSTDDTRLEVFKNPFSMIINGLIEFQTDGRFRLAVGENSDISSNSLQDYGDTEIGCRIQ